MCPRFADNEIGSMKALMSTVLNAVVIEVFRMGLGDIRPELELQRDLRMTAAQRARLVDLVAEYFDGLRLEIGARTTVGDVYAQVVEQ
jgi:hypothetical protein